MMHENSAASCDVSASASHIGEVTRTVNGSGAGKGKEPNLRHPIVLIAGLFARFCAIGRNSHKNNLSIRESVSVRNESFLAPNQKWDTGRT